MTPKEKRLAGLQRQIRRLEARERDLQAVSDRVSTVRLALAVAGIVATLVALFTFGQTAFLLSAALFIAAFTVLVRIHGRINRALEGFSVWRRIKLSHIARAGLDWPQIPPSPSFTANPEHPFDIDLDITGPRSLHHLLDTSISVEGSARLRDLLLITTPVRDEVLARQALVGELTGLPIFRDKLILNYRMASRAGTERWEARRLVSWLERHKGSPEQGTALRSGLRLLAGLAAVNIALTLLNVAGLIPPLQVVTVALYAALFLIVMRQAGDLFEDALALSDVLARLRAVLQHLETFPVSRKPRLAAHLAPFRDPTDRPSKYLIRINRVLAGASVQRNPFLWLAVNLTVPWDVFIASLLHRYKSDLAARLPRWLDALFDLEALSALASFAYHNPDCTVPEIVPASNVFSGQQLGHPLIPDAVRVCNDFQFDAPGQVVLITGSNMAGKSSFLRTLGLNLCLAYAGGPVNAARLRLSAFRLFTCIRVTDSVTDGFSYFYAEVRRLKALLMALERPDPLPLFFLIDEIFRGTNNRERLIGSRAYIQALVGKNGLGAISTHDLELVRLADEMSPVVNYHFREEVIDGRMVFDYKLRRGPSPTTNALKIMQMEGLPVPVG